MSNTYTEQELKEYFKQMLNQLAAIVGHRVASRVIQLQRNKPYKNKCRMVDAFKNRSGMNWLYPAFVWSGSPEGHDYWYSVANCGKEP